MCTLCSHVLTPLAFPALPFLPVLPDYVALGMAGEDHVFKFHNAGVTSHPGKNRTPCIHSFYCLRQGCAFSSSCLPLAAHPPVRVYFSRCRLQPKCLRACSTVDVILLNRSSHCDASRPSLCCRNAAIKNAMMHCFQLRSAQAIILNIAIGF